MKKIICLLLIIATLLSVSACGGVNLKTDVLATDKQIEELIRDKKEKEDKSFSVEFDYNYSASELETDCKYEETYNISGMASYSYNQNTHFFVLDAIKADGEYNSTEIVPTIAGNLKTTEKQTEKVVMVKNGEGSQEFFSNYSANVKNNGVKSKSSKKVYNNYGIIYSQTKNLLTAYVNTNFLYNSLSNAHFVFLSGNTVYTVNSYSTYHREVKLTFNNNVLKSIVIEYASAFENFTLTVKYKDYKEINAPKNKADYLGYKAQ